MKYTKENILGLTFSYGTSKYTIISIDEHQNRLELIDCETNNKFGDNLSATLNCFNNCSYHVIDRVVNNYSLY